MTKRLCEIQLALGRTEECHETERCPFWQDHRCVVEPAYRHVERNPALAQALLELRGRLDAD